MRTRLGYLRDRLRTSYWFVPALMIAFGVGLAFGMTTLDHAVNAKALSWVYTGSAQGARRVLSTVAGSMITVAGVVFSINIVALTLASQQFGPRLLRNYMRDTGNQVAFGTFLATFLYCLLVLRTVRGGSGEGVFVPDISVTVGAALALVSTGVLVYFIHHASVFIQAPHLLATVADDLNASIDRMFPNRAPDGEPRSPETGTEDRLPPGFDGEADRLSAAASGYIQAIDVDLLMEAAIEHDCVLRLRYKAGDFVIEGHEIACVWPASRAGERLCKQVNKALLLGSQRTSNQDIGFGFDQLAEVAVRSLSIGINDPFTAASCLDRVAEALCRLAGRSIPSPLHCDPQRKPRLLAPCVSFGSVVDSVFSRIWNYGRNTPAVVRGLLETLAVVAACCRRDEDRTALVRVARIIYTGSQETIREDWARRQIEDLYRRFLREAAPRP